MTVEVGKVAIRAIPDTKGFRDKLERALNKDARTLPPIQVRANIERVNINTQKVRKNLQDQFEKLRGLRVDVDVNANVKRLRGQLGELQEEAGDFDIVASFDRAAILRVNREIQDLVKDIELDVDVDSDFGRNVRRVVNDLEDQLRDLNQMSLFEGLDDADFEYLHSQMAQVRREIDRVRHEASRADEQLDDLAEDRTVRIDVNPFTAWASARLAWLSRPRVVEIIPKVSASALAAAGTALAALSGARMSYSILDDFLSWVGELDKKLPALTLGITAAATGFGALFDSVAGIVGIGDGLAATLPSLLVLPGLFAGAALSAAALFVALKYSKEELSELGDSYNKLGRIIRGGFWGEAREAIVEFSNSVMPQLERSFDRTSRSMGRFAAGLARSFQKHFANGRLEKMFDGLADAWDILATGTDAFAGAITNLGLVAARYMPRLSQWFVDLSIEFDNWLSAVSTDGRLDGWIEESIDSFYALWDVLAATTGIFQGIWKAAEAGGNEGLRGWADMLLVWEQAVQGQKWQETLTSFFLGANEAMSGLSTGLQHFGDMLHGLRDPIGNFIGEGGKALGTFIGNLSQAFNRPEIANGMNTLIAGLADGLAALEPAMGPIADVFGRLMGFIGDLAGVFGPLLSRVLEALAPVFTTLLDAIEPVIVILAEGLATAIETIAPVLQDFITSIDIEELATGLAEAFIGLTEALIPLLPALVPIINNLIEGLLPMLPDLVRLFESFVEVTTDLLETIAPHLSTILEFVGVLVQLAAVNWEMISYGFSIITAAIDTSLTVMSLFLNFITIVLQAIADVGESITKMIQGDFAGAAESARSALDGLAAGSNFEWAFTEIEGLVSRTKPKLEELVTNAKTAADDFSLGLKGGLDKGAPFAVEAADKIAKGAKDKLVSGTSGMDRVGAQFGQGFAQGIRDEIGAAARAAAQMARSASDAAKAELDINSPSRVARNEIGRMFGAGVVLGQEDSIADIRRTSARMTDAAISGMLSSRAKVVQVAGNLVGAAGQTDALGGASPGNTLVEAPVTVNMIERDPERVGRLIARGLGVALGGV